MKNIFDSEIQAILYEMILVFRATKDFCIRAHCGSPVFWRLNMTSNYISVHQSWTQLFTALGQYSRGFTEIYNFEI